MYYKKLSHSTIRSCFPLTGHTESLLYQLISIHRTGRTCLPGSEVQYKTGYSSYWFGSLEVMMLKMAGCQFFGATTVGSAICIMHWCKLGWLNDSYHLPVLFSQFDDFCLKTPELGWLSYFLFQLQQYGTVPQLVLADESKILNFNRTASDWILW